uniref:Enhancer of mRNA-decapping protein 4 WD40 repeat region domain-containing protein n=2 Tax=Plectus sambesii TaxID=2011161 RepID=A0A914UYY2_9BILA
MNAKKGRSRISPLTDFFSVEKHDLLSLPDGQTLSFGSGKNVVVQTGTPLKAKHDSGRVRSKLLSEFKWDYKLYNGNLVAVHHQSQYVAYILHSRNGSAVRVYHRSTKTRQLIRGFSGECVDIAWSHTLDKPLLACVDQAGNIYIYLIVESSHDGRPSSVDSTTTPSDEPSFVLQKHLVIIRDSPDSPNGVTDSTKGFRLVWCP